MEAKKMRRLLPPDFRLRAEECEKNRIKTWFLKTRTIYYVWFINKNLSNLATKVRD